MSTKRHFTFVGYVVLSLTFLSTCAEGHVSQTASPPAATAPPSPTASPQPAPENNWIRPPAYAGSWYPADPVALAELVDGLLDLAPSVDSQPLALVVPHAGYVFSGAVAATGYRQLLGPDLDVVVVIASDHQTPLSDPISVWAEGGFETPLGVMPVDADLAHALIDADPRINFNPAAHEAEHAIEVQIPFLQRACPDVKVVPVLMGDEGPETVRILSDALLSTLPGKRAVVIASSDLSHYPSYSDALEVDAATLAAIETGDPTSFRKSMDNTMAADVPNLVTCACGSAPIMVAMNVARGLGADTISVLQYANSGDSPHGDKERIVGYAAVMFWRENRMH